MRFMQVSQSVLLATATVLTFSAGDVLAQDNQVVVDGSSTVAPIAIAIAERFQDENPDISVSVATSGSGGGFKKFCVGETDVSNASRPIKQSEIDTCAENGINFVELPVAFDGLAVVVGKQTDWAECLTVEQLNTMWNSEAEGEINSWDALEGGFPGQPLTLFGPGTDSGTFDYFSEAILDEDDIRADFTPSEDDNIIVTGVAGTPGALGFFGLAYYEENADQLNVVAVDGGNGCVAPSTETVKDGTYAPLSRPLFVYVKATSLARPEVRSYIDFFLADKGASAAEVGYISLPEEIYERAMNRVANVVTGSVFTGVEPGTSIEEIFN